MTTYATMRSRIADELAKDSITSNINSAIQSAIKFYEREKFYFNTRVTDTFTTVANQEYYGSAALAAIPDLIEIDDMYATVDSTRYHLTPMTFEEMAGLQTGAVTGDPPSAYCYYAQQIRLYPIPSAARTITMADHYRLTALSADSDTNAWTTDAEELIRCHAKHDLAQNVLYDDGLAERMEKRIPALLAALRRETRKRRGMRVLRMPDFASGGASNIYVG